MAESSFPLQCENPRCWAASFIIVARRIEILPEVEIYTNERMAELLLNNALDEGDYRNQLREVIALGIDPLSPPVASLDREEPWKRAELYQDIPRKRRSS